MQTFFIEILTTLNFRPKANEILMMPHVDNSDAEEDAVDDGEGAKLLSRGDFSIFLSICYS